MTMQTKVEQRSTPISSQWLSWLSPMQAVRRWQLCTIQVRFTSENLLLFEKMKYWNAWWLVRRHGNDLWTNERRGNSSGHGCLVWVWNQRLCYWKEISFYLYLWFNKIQTFKNMLISCSFAYLCDVAVNRKCRQLRARRALLLYKVNGNSALLALNGTSLNCNNALLALNWRCVHSGLIIKFDWFLDWLIDGW